MNVRYTKFIIKYKKIFVSEMNSRSNVFSSDEFKEDVVWHLLLIEFRKSKSTSSTKCYSQRIWFFACRTDEPVSPFRISSRFTFGFDFLSFCINSGEFLSIELLPILILLYIW